MGIVEGPASDCTTFPEAARLVILATSRSSPECELELEREALDDEDGAEEDEGRVVEEAAALEEETAVPAALPKKIPRPFVPMYTLCQTQIEDKQTVQGRHTGHIYEDHRRRR